MASVFSHAFSAVALGSTFSRDYYSTRFWILGMLCALLPDADILAFSFGIPYEHMLGHRGLTHSLPFAAVWGLLMAWFFSQEKTPFTSKWWWIAAWFALCTASHGFFDAITNGGRGVAFFAPFHAERYFLPWRPVQVSPIGASRFFSEWGLKVILSELRYIWLPCALLILINAVIKQSRMKKKS